ncbi:MAG TPA: glycolate oxidase subunit GlcF [Methylophilaceae bacterium]|jgi:glycolate oxidase iron-sulfur subunit|nr:glycolate oxidase subunit GlcF [Methylophilaceae bacterium]
MQTRLGAELLETTQGQEADAILRKCVHCGFCNATCPTYQLRGDELDGPRGRIYLIKQMLEGAEAGAGTLLHLDRCLTCRNCETTCPSGVEYGRLLDIGRAISEERIPRPFTHRAARYWLRAVLTRPRLFKALLGLGRLTRPLLPATLAGKIPEKQPAPAWPKARHARRMLVLDGCVQPALAPNINAQAARVLDKLGISLIRAHGAGCCGALSQHLAAPEEARDFMRRNIDSWWPHIEAGVEAIVMTASGCGVQVKDYGVLLKGDLVYAEKAARVSALTRDIGEVLRDEDISGLAGRTRRVAYHPPCTLQHGQKLPGLVEEVLRRLGHELVPVADAHMCCGAAGTYSILQPEMARQLREEKLAALRAGTPEVIVSANIGCIAHLAAGSGVPVVHWLELIE